VGWDIDGGTCLADPTTMSTPSLRTPWIFLALATASCAVEQADDSSECAAG
jgi:hypothetical protein